MVGVRKILHIVPIALLTILLFVSCEEQLSHNGKTPLVSVGKEFLYKEDVEQHYAINRHLVDSAKFVNEYVRKWLEDALLYRVAYRNVSNSKEIEKMVDNYRRLLILNLYQGRLIDQRLSLEFTDEKVNEFYEQNKGLFLMKEPMVQGLYLKVAKKAPQLASVRKWLAGATHEDVEKLEKYSLTNALAYDYFVESWRALDDIAARMPITVDELLKRLEKKPFVEVSDTGAYYFVNAMSLLKKGETMPVDMASAEIRTLLINSSKANFIKKVKRDLFDQAIESEEIKIYDNAFSSLLGEGESANQ